MYCSLVSGLENKSNLGGAAMELDTSFSGEDWNVGWEDDDVVVVVTILPVC